MRKVTAGVAATILAAAVLAPVPAIAGDNSTTWEPLAGEWQSQSLKQHGVGYSLGLAATSGQPFANYVKYGGFFQFQFQDGRRGREIPVWMFQARDNTLYVVFSGGSFSSGRKVIKGSVEQDGSIWLPTCYNRLFWAQKSTADMDCSFAEEPL